MSSQQVTLELPEVSANGSRPKDRVSATLSQDNIELLDAVAATSGLSRSEILDRCVAHLRRGDVLVPSDVAASEAQIAKWRQELTNVEQLLEHVNKNLEDTQSHLQQLAERLTEVNVSGDLEGRDKLEADIEDVRERLQELRDRRREILNKRDDLKGEISGAQTLRSEHLAMQMLGALRLAKQAAEALWGYGSQNPGTQKYLDLLNRMTETKESYESRTGAWDSNGNGLVHQAEWLRQTAGLRDF